MSRAWLGPSVTIMLSLLAFKCACKTRPYMSTTLFIIFYCAFQNESEEGTTILEIDTSSINTAQCWEYQWTEVNDYITSFLYTYQLQRYSSMSAINIQPPLTEFYSGIARFTFCCCVFVVDGNFAKTLELLLPALLPATRREFFFQRLHSSDCDSTCTLSMSIVCIV